MSFHGPKIVAVSYLGHFVSVGCTLSIFSVFVQLVADDLGASMQQAGWGASLLMIAMGAGSPLVGWLLARRSARSLMLLGALLLGVGLVLVSRSLAMWQVGVALMGLVGVGALLLGGLPCATLVANWYVVHRGKALGFAATGTTSATLVLPLAAAFLIEQVGWRDALAWISVSACLAVMPFLWFWVIDRPASIGQQPDGRSDAQAAPPPDPRDADSGEILRNRNFWVLSIAFGLLFSAGQVMMLFTVPYAVQLGMTIKGGAALFAARAFLGILGKIALGALSDRMQKRTVLLLTLGMELCFWVVMIRSTTVEMFILAGLGMGFFSGALLPIKGSILGAVFGRASFSQAMGMMNFCRLPFQLLSAPLAGYVYDRTGDYADAFGIFIWGFVLAGAVVMFLRVPEVEPGLEPARVGT